MKKLLTKKDIEIYLNKINEKLSEQNNYGEINICGGAAMTLIYDARDSTHDIDAIYRPKDGFKEIIDAIAEENNLDSQWLNDDVTIYTKEFQKLTSLSYINLSNLSVTVMDAQSLLAMKLISARPESKDLQDASILIRNLDIKNIEELYELIQNYQGHLHPRILSDCKKFAQLALEKANTEKPSIIDRINQRNNKQLNQPKKRSKRTKTHEIE